MTTLDTSTSTAEQPRTPWTTQDSARLYGVDAWGEPYHRVSERGTMQILPDADPARAIDLHEVVNMLEHRGIETPILLRFPDLIRHRVGHLRRAFDKAIETEAYRGAFGGVYPVKVNQERHVIETVRDAAAEFGFGLEAGSKPELLAVLGMTGDNPDMPIVCNGFKDDEYAELVVLSTKMGRTIYPVVEKYSELGRLLRQAERYGVRPNLGVRAKLASPGIGRWESSGGPRSKFGLFMSEIVDMVSVLRERGMLDCLKLVHCHLGSQLCDIRMLKSGVTELTHIYCELKRLGCGVEILDVGGGLAVDYDGTRSNAETSMNYSIDEYALDVVYRVRTACDEAGVDHPHLMTESGRAMTAHGSVLVVDVPEVARFEADEIPTPESIELVGDEEMPAPIADLFDALNRVERDTNLLGVYHDATAARDQLQQLFGLGYVTLPQRASGERLFWTIGRAVLNEARKRGEEHEELDTLRELLCDHYICNFSLFQSLPDSWAIDQVFPIVPLSRLDEEPTRSCILHDVTCDSDGKVDRFVTGEGVSPVLPAHPLRAGERYTLGVFMVGAYQEILGDLHNLFGDQHAAHVRLDAQGRLRIDTVVEGDTVREVLEYVQIDPARLIESMERDAERAVDADLISEEEASRFRKRFRDAFGEYTYLRSEANGA
ncbi:MAG: biosynthetic arginine decarboxylase [Phycisphaerales bacterium]